MNLFLNILALLSGPVMMVIGIHNYNYSTVAAGIIIFALYCIFDKEEETDNAN